MRILTTSAVLFCCCGAVAQRPSLRFGEIPMEDLRMLTYPSDTSAGAVILFDYGEYDEYSQAFYRHTRIKVLKPSGYHWGNFSIPVHQGAQVSGFKAATSNLSSGRVVLSAVAKESRFKDKFNEDIEIIHWAHPGVKVGSVIEVQYNIKPYGIPQWRFQHSIPCRHSEFNILSTSQVKLNIQIQGYFVPQLINEDHWVLKDVPAFREEPYMLPSVNYISMANIDLAWISFRNYNPFMPMQGPFVSTYTNASSWDDLANLYRTAVENQAQGSGFLLDMANELSDEKAHPDKNLLAIYNHVKTNFQWNGRFTEHFSKSSLKKAYATKQGSSADLNMLLLSLLRSVGLPADPVLVSTRSNGRIRKEVPNFTRFNHVLIQTDHEGKKRLIDATDVHLNFGFVNQEALNSEAYWVKESGFAWIDVTNAGRTRTVNSFELQLSEGNELIGSYKSDKTGYAARDVRSSAAATSETKYSDSLFHRINGKVLESKIDDRSPLSPKTTETYRFSIPDYTQQSGIRRYLNPNILKHFSSNPFDETPRTYPIDFGYPRETITTTRFKIPADYDLEEIPSPKAVALPGNGGRFTYSVTRLSDEVVIVNQLSLSKTNFQQSDKDIIREFITMILATEAQVIVLKRKE